MIDKNTTSSQNNKVLSHPILHDLIKAYLVYDSKNILSFCSTIPALKRSRIFLPESPHRFYDSKQEWFVGGMKFPADAVWRFRRFDLWDIEEPSYYIIHEVKTGNYDITKEIDKHYIHHNHVQLYIWAYKQFHKENPKPAYSYIKQLDILSIRKYISIHTLNLINDWEMI